MVQAISGFRPYVSAVPPVVNQQRVNQIKLERNEVTDDLRNGKITDMQAMSERVALNSQLSDAKAQAAQARNAQQVNAVSHSQTVKPTTVTNPQEVKPANVAAMDRQQKGKELSQVEKQQIVENQMKQMAINNQVLHGLTAV